RWGGHLARHSVRTGETPVPPILHNFSEQELGNQLKKDGFRFSLVCLEHQGFRGRPNHRLEACATVAPTKPQSSGLTPNSFNWGASRVGRRRERASRGRPMGSRLPASRFSRTSRARSTTSWGTPASFATWIP